MMAFSLRNLRFRCAISWIQSYYDDLIFPFPREVLSYPYTDLYTFKIRPELVWWLTKGDPYFCLIAHIQSVSVKQVTSFEVAINRLGCTMDTVLLSRNDPIALDEHLFLIERIMLLSATTQVSIECIVNKIHKITGVMQGVDSLEDGLLLWVQSVCDKLRNRVHLATLVPIVTSISSSLYNGTILLLILHYYIPQCVQISNGKFPANSNDILELEDAFHNGTLVTNACMQIPQLKFCLSSQGIVRCSDPIMLPYVMVSLSSMFLCFEVTSSCSVYVPTLYGALIGRSPHAPNLLTAGRFHSMDSVAKIPSDNLLTPSFENLLVSQHSNPPTLYPRSNMSRIVSRPLSRLRTAISTVKSSSDPELSRISRQNTDILRRTQDLIPSGVLSPPAVIAGTSDCDVFSDTSDVSTGTGTGTGTKEAWSPLKQSPISNSSDSSIPSNESVANQEIITNGVIHLNLFPRRNKYPENPASLLLRTEVMRLKTDQSKAIVSTPNNEAIRQQLGQLAFSYVSTNQNISYEDYICNQLGISSIDKLDDTAFNQLKASIHIPNTLQDNSTEIIEQVIHPRIVKISDHIPTQLIAQKPPTFYTTGDDVNRLESPFATEKAKNMLRMLETRNSARHTNSAKQSGLKTQVDGVKFVTPSCSSNSLQSLQGNNIPIQQAGNHDRKVTKSKVIPETALSKHKSNKQIVKNAISDVCLAGGPNIAKKLEILSNLSESQSDHFLILFRDIIGCKFRGLYAYVTETGCARRIGGCGPREVTPEMLVKLYKYNSGSKEFQEIPARRISSSIDAVTIHDTLWSSKKRPVHL
ncbi:hypothetical protein LOD99_6782 [Oopsacas minuta]|uniref:CKK domain-containing protein n=1 Tax=Oopsacas minuta TaxID=111878 RepID=A0AAV7JKS2_9METZ|nr:hypothetical protein LOD99_6782 [Oopsacas minuta]